MAAGRLLLLTLVLVAVAGSAAADASVQTLPIGKSATFGEAGERVRVTLLQFVDPARSCCYRPRKGTRFVVFKLRYANLDRSTLTTVPAADAALVDTHGNVYDSTTFTYGSRLQPWPVTPPDLNHGLKLAPHKTLTGYLGWVLPTRMRLRQFRYSLNGYQTATWRLPAR